MCIRVVFGRAPLVMLVCFAIVLLAALAYASPIDPSFPGGLYDNGDFDDVIDFIGSTAGLVEAVPLPTLDGIRIVIGTVVDAAVRRPPAAPRSTSDSRAPPLPA